MDRESILTSARGKIVHLRIVGKAVPGANFQQPLHGSGVVIRTLSNEPNKRFRILTAGHVVKEDNAWEPLGVRRNRDVYVTTEQGIGAVELYPITGVSVNQGMDIAQVVAGPRTPTSAELKSISLVAGERYVVVSWGLDTLTQRIAESPEAKLVSVLGPDNQNPNLVRLEAQLVPTESGAPLLDRNGNVVAIVLMRETSGSLSSTALALPISQAAPWIEGIKQNPVIEHPPQSIDVFLSSLTSQISRPGFGGDISDFCIFLGKKSALFQANPRPEDIPFGRNILSSINENPMTNEVVGRPLSITAQAGAINVRSRCPTIQNGKAFYGSVVSALSTSYMITVRAVRPLPYLDDVFFWGLVSNIDSRR